MFEQQVLLEDVRRKYGRGVYATLFPTGLVVAWRPLTLTAYLGYDAEIKAETHLMVLLEDEIFRLCVCDQIYSRQLDHLPAGVISTVVHNIWETSVPSTEEALVSSLEHARNVVYSPPASIFYEAANWIMVAFPSYTPESVMDMDHQTLMLRLAQAEKKLMALGVIQEPFTFTSPEVSKGPPPRPSREKVDLKALWDSAHSPPKKGPAQPAEPIPSGPRMKDLEGAGKWWKKSPVLEAPRKEAIDFKAEAKEAQLFGSQNWDNVDEAIRKEKMIKDARVIYKDLLAELAKKKSVRQKPR